MDRFPVGLRKTNLCAKNGDLSAMELAQLTVAAIPDAVAFHEQTIRVCFFYTIGLRNEIEGKTGSSGPASHVH